MDLNFPVVVIAAAVSAIIAEVIHPHVYGLDLIPSIRIEIGDRKYLHIHHWIYALGGLIYLGYRPINNFAFNSIAVGILLGSMAQGLSYSTSHWVLYDRERFDMARLDKEE